MFYLVSALKKKNLYWNFYCGNNLCNYVVDDLGVEAKAFIIGEELVAGDYGIEV